MAIPRLVPAVDSVSVQNTSFGLDALEDVDKRDVRIDVLQAARGEQSAWR